MMTMMDVKSAVTCNGSLIGCDWMTVDIRLTADHNEALMIERRQLATCARKRHSHGLLPVANRKSCIYSVNQRYCRKSPAISATAHGLHF